MKILLVYASNSGGTYLASEIIGKNLRTVGEVIVKKARETRAAELNSFDALILGSNSWLVGGEQGQPPLPMKALLKDGASLSLEGKPGAVFGCGDSSYTDFCGAVDQLENFMRSVKASLVIAPLKLDGYFFNLIANEKSVERWALGLAKKLGAAT